MTIAFWYKYLDDFKFRLKGILTTVTGGSPGFTIYFASRFIANTMEVRQFRIGKAVGISSGKGSAANPASAVPNDEYAYSIPHPYATLVP